MTSLCRMCAYEQADCKGNKDLEKIKCEYFKKPQVFNAKEAAERIAELEKMVKELEKENKELKNSVTTKSMIPLVKDFIKDLEKLGGRATCDDIIKSMKR